MDDRQTGLTMAPRLARDPRTQRLLDGKVAPTLLRLALPNTLVMVVQGCIGLVETYFVAKLGLDALAGMSLVFPLLMMLQMISAGAVGGGVLSAVARALGAGQRDKAHEIVWAAVALTLALGATVTIVALLFGPRLYSAMGGSDGALAAASLYSAIVFAGAVPLWMFNSLAAIIRGAGDMAFPATVVTVGAIALIAGSPVLIFGLGPLPAMGIAGGGIAVVLYYVIGTLVFVWRIWSGRGVLKPPARPPRLTWAPMREILRVGAASSIVSLSTSITLVAATGFAGALGQSALAGFGAGVRLEYLLVPIVFGLGAPMAAMVGTAIGAGMRERALQVAWIGAAIAGGATEAIGVAAALFPHAWLGLFGSDPLMMQTGASYLRIVGPAYGFFGAGLALYFASQGAGQLRWPVLISLARVLISVAGGWIALQMFGTSAALFAALTFALIVFGVGNAAAILAGAWNVRGRG